jgi:hypothetical protein
VLFRPGEARPKIQILKDFVDQHRVTHGVEAICKVLQIAPSCYQRHAASQRNLMLCSALEQRYTLLAQNIQRVWQANVQVYGADKIWHEMRREGIAVALCIVERLMKRLGLRGVWRGKVVRTTIGQARKACSLDRVKQQLKAQRPDQLWVSDFTYVSTWQGWQHVALCH